MLACGLLSEEDISNLASDELAHQFSHLCGNPACANAVHIVLESQAENLLREKCHNRNKPDMCRHSPQCLPKSSWDVDELKTFIQDLKQHAASLQDRPAGPCLYDNCDFDPTTKTNKQLLVHMINAHEPPDAPPIVPKDMGCDFRNCTNVVYSRAAVLVRICDRDSIFTKRTDI